MLRNLIIGCLCTLTTPAWALCGGESYYDRLTTAQTAELAALSAQIPNGRGIIWTATRGADVMTIIGTMHINDPRLDAVMDRLDGVMDGVDLVLVEATAIEEAQVQAVLNSDPTRLLLPDDQTLPELMDAATWDRVLTVARDRNIPPFLVSKFQPWYLMMTLAIPQCALGDIAAGKRGLDHMIMDAATANDVPMQALEPFDTLFTIFQSETTAEQIETLKLSLLAEDKQKSMFVALLDSYFAQDIGRLMALNYIAATDMNGVDPDKARTLVREGEQALLFDRNIAWMDVIGAATDQHDTLVIAVGAAHLPGDQGVLRLLENDGWDVRAR